MLCLEANKPLNLDGLKPGLTSGPCELGEALRARLPSPGTETGEGSTLCISGLREGV